MSLSEEQRKRIESLHWYHEFDFGDGVKTTSIASYSEMWDWTETFLENVDFSGKRVLDIGCWDGFWSFYAERRGAASVLATDNNTQRWEEKKEDEITVANPDANAGFELAREIYNSSVSYRGDLSVYDVTQLGEKFDVVLFLGVYYHLTHPMYALTQIRHVLREGGVLVVEGGVINDLQRSYMDFYRGTEGGEPYRVIDASNWVVPTRRCLHDMVESNYLRVVDEAYLPHRNTVAEAGPAKRAAQHLMKRGAGRAGLTTVEPTEYGRMLVQARAVEEADADHLFEPQLGLSAYDPRFRADG